MHRAPSPPAARPVTRPPICIAFKAQAGLKLRPAPKTSIHPEASRLQREASNGWRWERKEQRANGAVCNDQSGAAADGEGRDTSSLDAGSRRTLVPRVAAADTYVVCATVRAGDTYREGISTTLPALQFNASSTVPASMRARLPSRRPGQPINAGRTRCPHFHFPSPPLPSHLARAPKRIKPAATDDSAGHRTLRTALDVGASRSVVRGGAASSHGQQEAVVVVPSGGVVLRGGRAVGGAIVVAPGGGPAAEQVPGGLREADGLHGLRDGPRGVALIHLLRRRRRHGEGAAGVPLLHHPAGAHGAQPGAVARPALRPPHRAPRRLQPPQRQRLALHQPAEPETGLAGLRPLRQRLQDHAIS